MSESETVDFCDWCSRNFPESELAIIYTVMNGIEQKERVCPDCEGEAREYEKPAARTDGGHLPSDIRERPHTTDPETGEPVPLTPERDVPMESEHRYSIDFPTRPCMKCGQTVEHRRERDHKQRHTNFECSNCHHKHTVK